MPANFFDSNILLYLATSDQPKALRAEDLLGDGGSISIQVLMNVRAFFGANGKCRGPMSLLF